MASIVDAMWGIVKGSWGLLDIGFRGKQTAKLCQSPESARYLEPQSPRVQPGGVVPCGLMYYMYIYIYNP